MFSMNALENVVGLQVATFSMKFTFVNTSDAKNASLFSDKPHVSLTLKIGYIYFYYGKG